ncbi:hypothetical protein V6N11_079791 [Hibiscus sabdariffa]|uniref:Uncharacterized protein n=1 Tax=Hibiscus sabdariffa TaxID=183260 RepID=A0ABR2RWN9_9ROSI
MRNTVGELNAGPTRRGNQTKSNQLQGAGENPEAGLRQVGDVRGSQSRQLGSENALQQKLEMWAWLVTICSQQKSFLFMYSATRIQ